MLKPLSTCALASFMFCMTASADAALPEETPLAGVDKKMPMLELLPVAVSYTHLTLPTTPYV